MCVGACLPVCVCVSAYVHVCVFHQEQVLLCIRNVLSGYLAKTAFVLCFPSAAQKIRSQHECAPSVLRVLCHMTIRQLRSEADVSPMAHAASLPG